MSPAECTGESELRLIESPHKEPSEIVLSVFSAHQKVTIEPLYREFEVFYFVWYSCEVLGFRGSILLINLCCVLDNVPTQMIDYCRNSVYIPQAYNQDTLR